MPAPNTLAPNALPRPTGLAAITTLKALVEKCREPLRTAEALAVVHNTANGGATVKIPIGGRLRAGTEPGVYEAETEVVVRLDHPVMLEQGRRRATVVGAELIEALHAQGAQAPISPIRPDPTVPTWRTLRQPSRTTNWPSAHIDVLEISLAQALEAVLPAAEATERQASWRPGLDAMAIGQRKAGMAPTLVATNGKFLAVARVQGFRRTRGTWRAPQTRDTQDGILIPAIAARALAAVTHARISQASCATVRIARERGARISVRFDDGTVVRTVTVKQPYPEWERILDRHPAERMRRVDSEELRNAFKRTANAADTRETTARQEQGRDRRQEYGNPAKRLYVRLGTDSIGLQAVDFDEELDKTPYDATRAEHTPASVPRSPEAETRIVDRNWFGHCIAQALYPQEAIDLFSDEDNESMMVSTTRNFFVMATFR